MKNFWKSFEGMSIDAIRAAEDDTVVGFSEEEANKKLEKKWRQSALPSKNTKKLDKIPKGNTIKWSIPDIGE